MQMTDPKRKPFWLSEKSDEDSESEEDNPLSASLANHLYKPFQDEQQHTLQADTNAHAPQTDAVVWDDTFGEEFTEFSGAEPTSFPKPIITPVNQEPMLSIHQPLSQGTHSSVCKT
jgi:hypothetical protein